MTPIDESVKEELFTSPAMANFFKHKQETRSVADMVNHPAHYKVAGMEVIDILESTLSSDEFYGYCLGNVYKYLFRHGKKNGLEDLKKAQWYLNKLVDFDGERDD